MIDRNSARPSIAGRPLSSHVPTGETHVSSLILSTDLRDAIVASLGGDLPYEGVGVLATRSSGSRMTAARFYPGQNMDASSRRYTMDPSDVMPALTDMERRGTRLGAVVHSHPNTSPIPSRTDLIEATWPGVLSLIVGFSPVVELRAWRLDYDGRGVAVRFDEVPIIGHDPGATTRFGFFRRPGQNNR